MIGPVKRGNGGRVPRLLEMGGTGPVKTPVGVVNANFAARPFMGPALEENKRKLRGLIQGKL